MSTRIHWAAALGWTLALSGILYESFPGTAFALFASAESFVLAAVDGSRTRAAVTNRRFMAQVVRRDGRKFVVNLRWA